MISWIVIMLLFWHYQKHPNFARGSKYRTIFWPPPRYFHPPTNQWQSFLCISYLLDKIYHYIEIISMISWIVIMLLFWHYQKLSQFDPGVKISRYFRPPTPSPPPNNPWKTVVCISYLLDKIYHYIKIILVIYWVVIMLLIWHYPKLRAKIPYDILTDSPQILNDKVLFAVHICLIRSISILTSLMISFLSSSNAFNF